MRNKNQLLFGGSIILFGLIILLGNLFRISIWSFIWPLLLIGIGVFLIFHRQNLQGKSHVKYGFVLNIKRSGIWEIDNREFWQFASDIRLDFTSAVIPDGDWIWQFNGFAHEIKLHVPSNVAVALTTHAFVTEKNIEGDREDLIFIPLEWKTDNFDTSNNRLTLIANGFVVNSHVIKIE